MSQQTWEETTQSKEEKVRKVSAVLSGCFTQCFYFFFLSCVVVNHWSRSFLL